MDGGIFFFANDERRHDSGLRPVKGVDCGLEGRNLELLLGTQDISMYDEALLEVAAVQ